MREDLEVSYIGCTITYLRFNREAPDPKPRIIRAFGDSESSIVALTAQATLPDIYGSHAAYNLTLVRFYRFLWRCCRPYSLLTAKMNAYVMIWHISHCALRLYCKTMWHIMCLRELNIALGIGKDHFPPWVPRKQISWRWQNLSGKILRFVLILARSESRHGGCEIHSCEVTSENTLPKVVQGAEANVISDTIQHL
jgi:hypothetical protein